MRLARPGGSKGRERRQEKGAGSCARTLAFAAVVLVLPQFLSAQ